MGLTDVQEIVKLKSVKTEVVQEGHATRTSSKTQPTKESDKLEIKLQSPESDLSQKQDVEAEHSI